MKSLLTIGKALALIVPVLFLSCASYNRQVSKYYRSYRAGDYETASAQLDRARILQKNRNRVLYLLEKGRMEHLLQNYTESNHYFNEADLLMEDGRMTIGDLLLSTSLNPMMETYLGEDFEKYMIHYYKAINYLQLGQVEEALVEARRITLRSHAQERSARQNRYGRDAFSLILQGMIFESGGEINNAFISYRNAANLYYENGGRFYGTTLPLQLKRDLIRTARLNGFIDEAERFETRFAMAGEMPSHDGGELILFWENGTAPVKVERNIVFSTVRDGSGLIFFEGGGLRIPFNNSLGQASGIEKAGTMLFRIAYPEYQVQPGVFSMATVMAGEDVYLPELAQDINLLAKETLRERTITELSKTLTRAAMKKLAEELARPPADEKDKKKKDKREAVAAGLSVFRLASEKADTRNWQSLPATISYARIPLQPGKNRITIHISGHGRATREITLEVMGSGKLQFRTISTSESL